MSKDMNLWKRFVEWCQRPDMIKIRGLNPGMGMAVLSRGARAGAISGVVFGAVQSPLVNFVFWVYGSTRARSLNLPYSSFRDWVAGMMQPWFLASIIMNIITGVVGGLIFGLIFVALYDKLPGKTPAIKGIVTSLIYWAAIPLGLPVLISLTRWGFEDLMAGFYCFFCEPYYWLPTAIGLGTSILWGWLLGHFWASKRLGKL